MRLRRNYPTLRALLLIPFIFSCQPKETDVEAIIDSMSLKEKIEYIGGYKSFNIREMPAYGVPMIRMADGPVGVRNFGESTAYPASITLAASWDQELAEMVGSSIGMEARSKNVHIMLGPAMNIHRGPYCGRNFEYLGEDPFLAGEIASAYTKGMQKEGVVATAKHYVANYQDYDRHNVSSDMDERTLHEIYLPAFKACVEKGKIGAVMTAYNLINGIHASEHNYLINEVLKEDWGFEGVVMSDWNSSYNGVACALGGLDLEMPSGKFMHYDTLMPAIESGGLSEEIIDEKVRRILNLCKRFGYFDTPDLSTDYSLDEEYVREVALEAARGGITLLKNEKHSLPVARESITKIAVIGQNAHPAVTGGGGSSYTRPLYPVSLFEAIKQVAGDDIEVIFSPGVFKEYELPEDFFSMSEFYIYEDGERKKGISASFYPDTALEGEAVYTSIFSRLDHTLHDSVYPGLPQVYYSARFEGFFTVPETGNYKIAVSGDDGYRVYLNDKLIIDNWKKQAETVRSIDVPLSAGEEYEIMVEYYQDNGNAAIRLGYSAQVDIESQKKQLWQDATDAATSSDLVVFAVGFNRHIESEGSDRSWELPEGQDEMIKNFSVLNDQSIVVLNAGGNVNMPWLNDVEALIHAWYPGQEGNLAVAEIIFGITNPSGKLPVSFERRWEDNATYTSYFDEDGDKKVYFTEGIMLGYRHFDQEEDLEPLFPFGYGLSYTSFDYSDLKVEMDQISVGDSLEVRFILKNTGDRAGSEICQLYVTDQESELVRPVKELKGFEKVYLKAGEEKDVSIRLDPDVFSYYHPERGGWYTEPGKFDILIGSSSKDIHLKSTIDLFAE